MTKSAPAPEFLKASQIAAKYGVTARHITQLACEGTIPGFRIGTTWRFDPEEVHKALKNVKAVTRTRSNTIEP